jgi:hypothetical protein
MKGKKDQRKKGFKPPFFRNNSQANQQGQAAQNEQKNADSFGKRPRKQPVQCWGCEGNHLYRDFPHKGERMRTYPQHNIISLGSYDCLIGMDWFEKHHVILDCYNKTITCLDEEGKQGKIQGIPRVVVVREISVMQLKKSFRKGCHMFAAHMEEATKDKVESIEDHLVLRDFEDVFREIPGFSS